MPTCLSDWCFIMIKQTHLLLLLSVLIVSTFQCHYTCSSCTSNLYNFCTTCPNSQPLTKTQGYSSSLIGVCGSISTSNDNLLGLFLVVILISACVIFPTEEIIHFTILIQTLGLLYLVEGLWSAETNYILSAFTYLMAFSKINSLYIGPSGSIQLFKSQIFFKTSNISTNFSIIGAVNLFLVLLMIAIPVFKAIRKRINKERANCLSDTVLSKILLCVNFAYLMMIQQSQLNIYFGLKYSRMNAGDIVITILYFLSLIFFSINQWFYPFTFFRSKFVQLNIIFIKIIIPIFIVSPQNMHFLAFVYIFIFYSIDVIFTNKNRDNSAINRLFLYKLYSFLVFTVMGLNYGLDIAANKENTSYILGIFSTLLLCGLLNLFAIQFCYKCKQKYCVDQKNLTDKIKNSIEITHQSLDPQPKKRVNSAEIYNFMTLQPENNIENSSEINQNAIMLPLSVIKNQQHSSKQQQDIDCQINSMEISQRPSESRFSSPSAQKSYKTETFEDVLISVNQKQKADDNQSQIASISGNPIASESPKRKSKKRKRQQ